MFRAGFDYSWSEASFALAEEDGTVLITPGLEDAFQLAEGQEREQVVIQP